MKKEQIGMDLSIIVPVYNVEKYIRACIESIYRQGLDENCFELIIVNDGTQDQSMDIISDIIEQHNRADKNRSFFIWIVIYYFISPLVHEL